jgi:bifunctional ADP-heptose synthase (sugar kinase/adenylyltransferase)
LLIRVLKPDVLVKGGDWKPEQIVGADVVKAYGGEVRSLRFVEGFSTSGLLARLRNG